MKITVDMENLSALVEESMENSLTGIIKQEIKEVVKNSVDEQIKDIVRNKANEVIKEYIDDYLKNTKIKLGGGWNNEPERTLTVEAFLKEKIDEIFSNGTLKFKTKDRCGYTNEERVTFEEYINKYCDTITPNIEKGISKIANELKDRVNKNIKTTFDESMKNVLAENVFAVVASSDTYRNLLDSVKLISEV